MRWTCLMYHEVLDDAHAGGPSAYFAVSRDEYARQLDQLRALGLRVASLADCAAGRPADVCITFDDGHWTAYDAAFPALVERGLTATFYVVTSWVDTPGYVTWAQLDEMRRHGMNIGSHTHTHPFLSTVTRAQAVDELQRSKAILEERLGVAVPDIGLPNGDFPRGFDADAFAALGYRTVGTSHWGPNTSALSAAHPWVRRSTVRRGYTPEFFGAVAAGRSGALSAEGIRLRALWELRRVIGAERYAGLRRRALTMLKA
jgi:peptidoglycan/xylan/chitin deacetylase (PgdA/CDA1 family)